MEKLSLEKFQDLEINRNEQKGFYGGSGSTCTCKTNPSWHETDTQTDYYDDCGDYTGSSVYTYSVLTNDFSTESW